MQILGNEIGLTYSHKALRAQIEAAGWQVTKVKLDSKEGRYVAEAKNARGVKLERKGKTEQLALSNLLIAVNHRSSSTHIGRWNQTFTDQQEEIAQAYSKAPIYEPKASAAFMALAKDCERRVQVLSEHLEIQIIPDPEPYKTSEQLIKDVKKSRRLKVSRAGADHPVWNEQQVVAYRICHDVFGYVASGAGWDWPGENEAFAFHVQLVPEEAQKALFVESIAHTAYATYYRAYGQQKVCLLPQFMDKAQKQNNPFKGHPGVHPSQTLPAGAQPSVKPIVASYEGWLGAPAEGLTRTAAGEVNYSLADPNSNYQSPYYEDPMTTANGLTLQEAHGDPLDTQATADTARMIEREWAYLNQNDPADLAKMKNAIVNAFRVVILSPKKSLKWNAIQYQDINHIPGDDMNPRTYHTALDNARQEWNVARGHDRFGHIPYMKYLNQLTNVLYQRQPKNGFPAAQQSAKDLLFDWVREEQQRIQREDVNGTKPDFQIEAAANYGVEERLKTFLAEHKPNLDKAMTKEHRKYFKENPLNTDEFAPPRMAADVPDGAAVQEPGGSNTLDVAKYQGFMNNHVVQMSQISEHADEILKAALTDVHEHDGTGHHFRAVVLQLNLPGISTKTCSFAWLLLAPMTSELATIDVHMMDVLGGDETQMNNRDYFGYERMLQAGRDAAGYSHIPLGQFQWGMWDYKRTGPGSHQDHGPLAVQEPSDPINHEWHPNVYNAWWLPPEQQFKYDPSNEDQAKRAESFYKQAWRTNPPEWWAQTKPAQQQAWDDFQQNLAPKAPIGNVPYIGLPNGYQPAEGQQLQPTARVSGFNPVPWLIHPRSGERIQGQPGQTIMQHAMSTLQTEDPRDVWRQMPDEAVGKNYAYDPVDPYVIDAW